LVGEALAKATAEAEKRRPEFEQRLASIGAEITRAEQALDRYYEAFEQGKLSPERCEDRLTRLQARLDDLRAQEAELSVQAPDEARAAATRRGRIGGLSLFGTGSTGSPFRSRAAGSAGSRATPVRRSVRRA
jgi:exonuclease VII small subunit